MRIIVIGAGVAGLAAAARMASAANEVVLLERGPSAGGGLNLNGPFTLTLPAVLRDLFVKTGGRKASGGGSLEENVSLVPVDPVRRYVFADGSSLVLPNTARGAAKDAFDTAFGNGAGASWLSLLDHGNRAWSAIRPTLVEVPDATRGELWRLYRSGAGRRALTPRRTLRQAGEGYGFRDPRMSAVLAEYALGAGADPRVAPAVLAIRPYIEHAFGAWRVVGGGPELARAMYERCLARNVTFRFGAEATAIASGAVTLASGERLTADVIVAAVDEQILRRLTGGAPAGERASKASTAAGYSPSLLSAHLHASKDLDLPHESVFFGDTGRDASNARLDALFADPAAYAASGGLSVPADPTLRISAAPEQPREFFVHVDVPAGLSDEAAHGYVPTLVELAARRLGLSSDNALTLQGTVTPADRERLTGVPGGSVNGPAITSVSSALLRSPTVQPVKGLLHVGASSRPGPGLAFAALSAWNAAEVLRPTRI
ncbi:phytoene desaturase family protein [Actinospica robiniae]|uniref:phytoene desaturase family protein n=1 Tax=Actinospica robiniae TaxID=304901 RepID=UPI00146FB19D|nr:FAD-binding protein [Actinospica robiniae]